MIHDIPGMVQVLPGITFTHEIEGNPWNLVTAVTVHSLESLSNYPNYLRVKCLIDELTTRVWEGCSVTTMEPHIPSIYQLEGLKLNDRSNTSLKQSVSLNRMDQNSEKQIYDGFFNLASTIEEVGNGIFKPAIQASDEVFSLTIASINRLLHDLYYHIMPKSISRCDPGTFFWVQHGLYYRGLGIVIMFFIFKGTEVHSGHAAFVIPKEVAEWVESMTQKLSSLFGLRIGVDINLSHIWDNMSYRELESGCQQHLGTFELDLIQNAHVVEEGKWHYLREDFSRSQAKIRVMLANYHTNVIPPITPLDSVSVPVSRKWPCPGEQNPIASFNPKKQKGPKRTKEYEVERIITHDPLSGLYLLKVKHHPLDFWWVAWDKLCNCPDILRNFERSQTQHGDDIEFAFEKDDLDALFDDEEADGEETGDQNSHSSMNTDDVVPVNTAQLKPLFDPDHLEFQVARIQSQINLLPSSGQMGVPQMLSWVEDTNSLYDINSQLREGIAITTILNHVEFWEMCKVFIILYQFYTTLAPDLVQSLFHLFEDPYLNMDDPDSYNEELDQIMNKFPNYVEFVTFILNYV
ncbi:hypothetical protein C8Q75DRAFT_731774 [Abortiporus biennis]|nr:hypothetical protein C8Q75DRAFT_731774 [Abortiporus biennis]